MSENQLELEIKDFRAIQEARIALNGITVISGENGCGKSTISKLMYHSVKAINEYEEIVYKPLFTFLKKVNDTFINTANEFLSISPGGKNTVIEKITENIYSINNIPSIVKLIKTEAQSLKEAHRSVSKNTDEKGILFINRLKVILAELIKDNGYKEKEWDEIIDAIILVVNQGITLSEKAIDKREVNKVIRTIERSFKNEPISSNLNLYEYGVCITDYKINSLLNLSTINKVLYIDTPMAVGLRETNIQHWEYLNETLQKNEYSSQPEASNVSHFLTDEILNGEASFDTKAIFGQFTYRRKDGLLVDLLDCATGIKSFAILQILLKNGYLDNKTLLIIDEPEAHLHPQWIVEYARIVTLLNKELGVKFLIASHNPDMISALKYISEKEDVSGNLNFYLAEKGEKETYTYKGLGTEIDEIFNSFNIAIDRINQYGASNDEVF